MNNWFYLKPFTAEKYLKDIKIIRFRYLAYTNSQFTLKSLTAEEYLKDTLRYSNWDLKI